MATPVMYEISCEHRTCTSLLTEGSVQKDIKEIQNARVSRGKVRNNSRYKDVDSMYEHLADDLFRNIE